MSPLDAEDLDYLRKKSFARNPPTSLTCASRIRKLWYFSFDLAPAESVTASFDSGSGEGPTCDMKCYLTNGRLVLLVTSIHFSREKLLGLVNHVLWRDGA